MVIVQLILGLESHTVRICSYIRLTVTASTEFSRRGRCSESFPRRGRCLGSWRAIPPKSVARDVVTGTMLVVSPSFYVRVVLFSPMMFVSFADGQPVYWPTLPQSGGGAMASVFDCTCLRDALLTDDVAAPVDGGADVDVLPESPANVYVPGAASYVHITKQMVLRLIIGKLQLRLYGRGTFVEETGLYCGWLEIDTPAAGVNCIKGRERFYGGEEPTQCLAMESVCSVALDFLCANCHVVVKDLNYDEVEGLKGEVKELKSDLEFAQSFHSGVLERLRWMEKREDALKKSYADFFKQIKGICRRFSDFLPIQFVRTLSIYSGGDNYMPVYGGAKPPANTVEQLGFALVDLLDRGTELFSVGSDIE